MICVRRTSMRPARCPNNTRIMWMVLICVCFSVCERCQTPHTRTNDLLSKLPALNPHTHTHTHLWTRIYENAKHNHYIQYTHLLAADATRADCVYLRSLPVRIRTLNVVICARLSAAYTLNEWKRHMCGILISVCVYQLNNIVFTFEV